MNSDPRHYMRIAAGIRKQIAAGTLAPGCPVPSATALTKDHNVSRITACKALRLLEGEGLIWRVPGMGYHVIGQQAAGTADRTWRCSCGEQFDAIPALEDHLFVFPEDEHYELAEGVLWPVPAGC